jgi:cytochrome c553
MRLLFAVAAGIFALHTAAHAGDAVAGRKIAIKCQVCHGLDGVSKNPDAPNLSGQVERYLLKSLMAFKAGERKNDQMTVIVKQLQDADIENVATYFSSIKITVEKPK